MSKAIIFLVLIYYSVLFLQPVLKPCWAYYSNNSTERLIARLFNFQKELVRDIDAKIMAIMYIRKMYDKTTVFQMGEMAYGVRNKMKRMMDLYGKADNSSLEPINRTRYMIEVQQLSMHCERTLRMMEQFEYENQPLSKRYDMLKASLRSRNVTDVDGKEALRQQKESRRLQMMKIAAASARWAHAPAVLDHDQQVENGFDSDDAII